MESPGVGLLVAGALLKPCSSVVIIDELFTWKTPRFPLSADFFNTEIAYSSVTGCLNRKTKITIRLPGLEGKEEKNIHEL